MIQDMKNLKRSNPPMIVHVIDGLIMVAASIFGVLFVGMVARLAWELFLVGWNTVGRMTS